MCCYMSGLVVQSAVILQCWTAAAALEAELGWRSRGCSGWGSPGVGGSPPQAIYCSLFRLCIPEE